MFRLWRIIYVIFAHLVMDDCVFCNIVNKAIESKIEFEDEGLIVIRDILPKAPVHLLVIPKKHIVSVNHMKEADKALVGQMVFVASLMAEKFGIAETGYKLVLMSGGMAGW